MNDLNKKQGFNTLALSVFLFFMLPFLLRVIQNPLIKLQEHFSISFVQNWIDGLNLFSGAISPLYGHWSFLLVGIVAFVNRDDPASLNLDPGFFGDIFGWRCILRAFSALAARLAGGSFDDLSLSVFLEK